MNDILKVIWDFSEKNLPKDDIHGFSHVQRVYNLCLKIGNDLKANLEVLKIATLLHDVGRSKEKIEGINKNHAEISAKLAEEIFKPFNDEFKHLVEE